MSLDSDWEKIPHGFTYDYDGKLVSFKNYDGYWSKYTYDDNGKEVSYKNSNGDNVVYFFWGIEYAIGYDANTKMYKSGCQYLTYKQCEKYYEENKDVYADSHNIIKAIREHQKTLTESEKVV